MRFFVLTSLASALVGIIATPSPASTIRLSQLDPAPIIAISSTSKCERPATIAGMIAVWPTIATLQLNPSSDFSATSIIRFDLDASGQARNFSVLGSSGNVQLDANALRAAQEATYTAALSSCEPVGGSYKLIVDYDT